MKDIAKLIGMVFVLSLMVGTFMLSGCTKDTPVDNIADGHIGHIDDVLDYSYNNMEQTSDVVFLEKELKACQIGIEDVRQACKAQISTEKGRTDYWRLASFGLLIMLVGAVFAIIKRWFK